MKKNINNGLYNSPHFYDGYDVLHEAVKNTVNGSHLRTGIYRARVLSVLRETDPSRETKYRLIAWIPELDKSLPEPSLYTSLKLENINGIEDYFFPQDPSVPEPAVGMHVNIMITDPYNRIGYYVGPLKDFENKDIIGRLSPNKKEISPPSSAFGE